MFKSASLTALGKCDTIIKCYMQGFVAMVPAILQQPVGYVCADRGFAGVSPRGKVYKQCQKTKGREYP